MLIVSLSLSSWIHYGTSALKKKKPRTAEKKRSSATSNENRKSQANHDMYLCCIPLTASICYLLSALLLTALKLKRTLNRMSQSCQNKTDICYLLK